MSQPCPLGRCEGDGLLFDHASNTAYDCECRPQVIARRRARSLSAVIPKRYRHASFDRPPVTDIDAAIVSATRRFVNSIEEKLDQGRGLSFMGPVGTGKTTLAMIVSRAALDAGRTVAIYSLPDLLRKIRHTFDTGDHDDLFDRLTSVDLLHIDDIGAEQTTPWVLEELYSIVNARYEDQRSIVITTNIDDPEKLSEQITPRTVSRLVEMCDDVYVEGPDRRMEPHPA